ncbi:MAG: hypothetical protein AB8G99_11235, partial [Planctomycetaceae bacterium]
MEPEARQPRRGQSLLTLFFLVGLGIAAAPTLRSLRLDNNLERWLSHDDPAAVQLARFYELFPREERLL